jgi:hypothetical protein
MRQYDKLILRATHIPGFLCNSQTEVFFWTYCKPNDPNWITATLSNPDKDRHIIINLNQVDKAYDHLTGNLIYSHDPRINI